MWDIKLIQNRYSTVNIDYIRVFPTSWRHLILQLPRSRVRVSTKMDIWAHMTNRIHGVVFSILRWTCSIAFKTYITISSNPNHLPCVCLVLSSEWMLVIIVWEHFSYTTTAKQERVESGAADDEMVVLKGLRKVLLGNGLEGLGSDGIWGDRKLWL